MNRWYLHPEHGYMLRGPVFGGWQVVVTALCLDSREDEESPEAWAGHKHRLRVNAGCGAVAADAMQVGDHNPDFVPVEAESVPAHIRADFEGYL